MPCSNNSSDNNGSSRTSITNAVATGDVHVSGLPDGAAASAATKAGGGKGDPCTITLTPTRFPSVTAAAVGDSADELSCLPLFRTAGATPLPREVLENVLGWLRSVDLAAFFVSSRAACSSGECVR